MMGLRGSRHATVLCGHCGATNRAQAGFCQACGVKLEVGNGALAAKRGRWPVWVTRGKLITAAVLVVVLGVGAYLWRGANVSYPPEQPVRDYFAALARRDTPAAAALAGLSSSLLAGDALAHGYEPPTDLVIGDVSYGGALDQTRRPNKHIAYVEVTYTLAGRPYQSTIEVLRARDGPVRPWSLGSGTTGLIDVISEHVTQATVARASVATLPTKRLGGGTEKAIAVPPGVYQIGLPEHPLLAARAAIVAVPAQLRPSSTVQVPLELELAAGAGAAVDKATRLWLDQCARQHNIEPPTCGFRYDAYTDGLFMVGEPSDVRWTIHRYPTLTLTVSRRAYDGMVTFTTDRPGAATVVFTATVGSARKTYTKDVEIKVVGAAALDEQGQVALKTFGKG